MDTVRTFDVGVLPRPVGRSHEWIKVHDPVTGCQRETPSTINDMYRLKRKQWKIYHANRNPKRAEQQ